MSPALVIAIALGIGAGARLDQRPPRRVRPGARRSSRPWARLRSTASLLIELAGAKTVTTDALPAWLLDVPATALVSIGEIDLRPLVVVALLVVADLPARASLSAVRPAPVRDRLQPRRRAGGRLPRPARRVHGVRAVRRPGRPRRVHVPCPVRQHHGRRRSGPRAPGRRRGRGRWRQHLRWRRLGRRGAPRRDADRPAPAEPHPLARRQPVPAGRAPRAADPARGRVRQDHPRQAAGHYIRGRRERDARAAAARRQPASPPRDPRHPAPAADLGRPPAGHPDRGRRLQRGRCPGLPRASRTRSTSSSSASRRRSSSWR